MQGVPDALASARVAADTGEASGPGVLDAPDAVVPAQAVAIGAAQEAEDEAGGQPVRGVAAAFVTAGGDDLLAGSLGEPVHADELELALDGGIEVLPVRARPAPCSPPAGP